MANDLNADLSQSTQFSLGQMHPLTSLPGSMPMHLQSRGSISQHNTLGRRSGNGILSNGPISNYATISRAAHGQLMNGGTGHFLNTSQHHHHPALSPLMNAGSTTTGPTGGSTPMYQQIPATMSHASLANSAFYGASVLNHASSLLPHHQATLAHHQSLYSSSPFVQQTQQFVGLEAHLELVDQAGCCCFSTRCRQRCSLSRVKTRRPLVNFNLAFLSLSTFHLFPIVWFTSINMYLMRDCLIDS